MTIPLGAVVRRHQVDVAEVVDHLLVHDPRQRSLHALNPSARAVWDACAEPRTPDDVLTMVADAVGLPRTAIDADVYAVLDQFRDGDLLRAGDDGPEPDQPTPTSTASDRTSPVSDRLRTAGDGALVIASLEWTAVVTCPDHAVMARLAGPLCRLRTHRQPDHRYDIEPAGPDAWSVYCDGVPIRAAASLPAALEHLLWHLNHQAVTTADHSLLLHAGSVAGPTGAVAIAGEPDAGKSTLTAACVLGGLAYLTDEATAIDLDDHRVTPYAKALTLDAAAVDLLSDRLGAHDLVERTRTAVGIRDLHVDPATLGSVASSPATLAAVVLPDRHTPGSPMVALDPVAAALALAQFAFNLDRTRARGLAVVAHLAVTVPVIGLPTIDVATAVDAVRSLAGVDP